MRRWIEACLFLAALAAATPNLDAAPAPPPAGGAKATLVVSLKGFEHDRGTARLALFRSAKGFPGDPAAAMAKAAAGIRQQRAEAQFADLEPGVYAVSVFHDENDNERLDTGAFGIPAEPYGASNDARNTFGPPAFKDAAVTVTPGTTTIVITVK